MMFLQGWHIPHAFGHAFCISLSDLQIEGSKGQLVKVSSHLQTLHVWGHNFLKAGISQLFAFAMHEVFWSLQSKPTDQKIRNYGGKENPKIKKSILKNLVKIPNTYHHTDARCSFQILLYFQYNPFLHVQPSSVSTYLTLSSHCHIPSNMETILPSCPIHNLLYRQIIFQKSFLYLGNLFIFLLHIYR